MQFIKGNIKKIIFTSESGFLVALFRVKNTSDELKDLEHKLVTITGLIVNANEEDTYILTGSYTKHERFGMQFQFNTVEKVVPEGKDAVIEFLASSFIKGCGEKTATAIVNTLGENALNLIKENESNLMLVPGMTDKKASNIYLSIMKYNETDELLIKLKELGFSIPEATKIVKRYKEQTLTFIKENIYYFLEYVTFDKLDHIFIKNHDFYDPIRLKACTLEAMSRLSNQDGNIYYDEEEIKDALKKYFQIILEDKVFHKVLDDLTLNKDIVIREKNIFLKKYDDMESDIASILKRMMSYPPKEYKNIERELKYIEDLLNVHYNEEQEQSILKALKNPISIISGGPGTGKTTIVNAITKLYIELYQLSPLNTLSTIALVAPTGRAAKKLATSTNLPAMTIHRYLKWNKETNEFGINEMNKNPHKLIIVDETSMIDTELFVSLLKGINENSQLVLVGDTFQLPSVGPGLILNDLVTSQLFCYTELETIYRQSNDSYIPILAKEIKEKELESGFTKKRDDYNFLPCTSKQIRELLEKIIESSLHKGLKVDDIQVLVPMYKGENGIDNLNVLLQDLFNPKEKEKKEIKYYDATYRENDKVLQLVNNPDNNVYNGDIGYILSIKETGPKKNLEMVIDFDGNLVIYHREDLISIKHAYAMTIHKSQGSEFSHVIMPISKNYYHMLYNKLIYTGVSRAKKSLILIGEIESFQMAILNDYATNRHTDLKNKLWYTFHG